MTIPSDRDRDADDDRIARLDREVAALRYDVTALRTEVADLRSTLVDGRSSPSATEDPSALPRPARDVSDEPPLAPIRGRPPLDLDVWRTRFEQWRCRATELVETSRARLNAAAVSPSLSADDAIGMKWEIGLVVVLVAIAGFLRFHDLTSLPAGLHGDEGVAGLDGVRILNDGWIGPYSPGALGQPTGPLYLTAASIWVLGDTLFAVRFVPALIGTLTIPALYVVARRSLGVRTAVAAGAILAVMSWHIHFARVGFPLESWPLIVILTVGAMMEALRGDDWRWWAATGGLAALGMYVYNGQPVFLAALGLFLLYRLYRWSILGPLAALTLYAYRPGLLSLLLLTAAILYLLGEKRLRARQPFVAASAFGFAALIVGLPLLRFAADERNGYFNHARTYSLLNKPEWTSLDGIGARLNFFQDRYVEFWNRLSFHPLLDGVDATGITVIVPFLLLLMAIVGVALGIWLRRGPLVALALLTVLLMPIGSVITIDGLARRTFAMAPFLALLAAVGIVETIRFASTRVTPQRYAIVATVGLVTAIVAVQNLSNYFDKFANAPTQRWVYAQEITDAALYMRDLPTESHVYFFSSRWSVNYETRLYLAPDVAAEDRAEPFGQFSLSVDPALGEPIFILIGEYRAQLEELRRLYPGGAVVLGGPNEDPTFIAYLPTASGRG